MLHARSKFHNNETLELPSVKDTVRLRIRKYAERLAKHPNPSAVSLWEERQNTGG